MDDYTVAWEAWGLPMCVEWGVIFSVGCHKEREEEPDGGVDLKRSDGKGQPQRNSFWMIYILRAAPLRRANDLGFFLFALFSSQNPEQQQHQRHLCFQLQPHAQTANLVSHTAVPLSLSGGRRLFKMKLYSTCMHTQRGEYSTISMGINVIPNSFGKQP